METQDGPALGLMSVSTVRVGDKDLYIFGGASVGKEAFSLVFGFAHRNARAAVSQPGSQFPGGKFDCRIRASVAGRAFCRLQSSSNGSIRVGKRFASLGLLGCRERGETFQAMSLLGRQGEVLSVLLVGSSQREAAEEIERRLLLLATMVAALGLVFGLFLSWWGAAAVTNPVKRLETCARDVAEGRLNTRANVSGNAEIRQLASAFNRMSEQLGEQRDRLMQTERAASWRELARRLADELRNPTVGASNRR